MLKLNGGDKNGKYKNKSKTGIYIIKLDVV